MILDLMFEGILFFWGDFDDMSHHVLVDYLGLQPTV